MRCSAGTNVGLDWLTVARTKSTIAFFAGPSFHEANGSSKAEETGPTAPITASAAEPLNKFLRVISMRNPVHTKTKIIREPNHCVNWQVCQRWGWRIQLCGKRKVGCWLSKPGDYAL